MYLSKLKISNFRAIKNVDIIFQKGVNIIIGENNAGKSSIVDALRICLGYGKSDNTISIKETDLHLNRNNIAEKNNEIQFDLVFEIEDAVKEKQCFYDFLSQDATNPNKQTIQLHLKFTLEKSGRRNYFKRIIWGGDNEGQLIPYEALEEIFFIYLDPLRDAVTNLKPYSQQNKIGNLYNELTKYKKGDSEVVLNEEKKLQLAKDLYTIFENESGDWKSILQTGNEKVNEHLEGTGISAKYPNIRMNYVGRKFSDVVKGIELKRPIYKESSNDEQKYFEIHQNGLGENNLIYASVVLGDLINRCEDPELQIYNALLVEEPEAHLHPQYQNTFFSYLNKLKDSGVQIFITSHSPTITAKSELRNIVVLQKQDERVAPFCFSILTEGDYSDRNRNHLKKFLDVSKSQLFFANGVLLVEGISEALILPILSERFIGINLQKCGIETVNINGVAFEHFARLFNNPNEKKRLLSRCAILTDSDPKNSKPKSDRALKAESYTGSNLTVKLAPNSFEIDLFNAGDINKAVMRFVYRGMHPQTESLKTEFDAQTLWAKLEDFKDKGDFALELQNTLKDVVGFEVPLYIKEAIDWLTKSDQHVQPAN